MKASSERKKAGTSDEANDLHWLMNNMTSRHIPGLTGDESISGFCLSSADWIREKVGRMLANCLNPDSFALKLVDMFGRKAFLAVCSPETSKDFTAGIR